MNIPVALVQYDPQDSIRVHRAKLGLGRVTAYLPKDMLNQYQAPAHSSSVRDYQECPAYYMFRDRIGLHIPGAYQQALSIGSAFHKALEVAYKGGGPVQRRTEVLGLSTRFLTQEVRPRVNDLGLLPNGDNYQQFSQKVQRDALKALAMAEVYLSYYPAEPEKYEVVASEQHVVAKFVGSLDMIQGTIDLMLRHRKTKALWICDFKTCSGLPWDTAQAVTIDVQPEHYRLLAMAAYPKDTIAGFIHDIVQKPGIKFCPDTTDKITQPSDLAEAIQTKLESGKPLTELQQKSYEAHLQAVNLDQKYGDPFEKYLERMVQWYQGGFGRAEAEGPDPFTGRVRHPILRSQVPFYKAVLDGDKVFRIRQTCKAARARLDPANFPKCCNMYTCHSMGHTCEYLPLCSTSGNMGVWPDLISRLFVQRHRDEEVEGVE